VDQIDFGHLQACLSGWGLPQNSSACRNTWLDNDEDVDVADFMIFHRCLTGSGTPAAPDCEDQ